ncbi:MAG: LAGLIDADG family homing endonuclease [Actinobacteria bacterium]|nr:LAGLIDADG family homing endonuclease [Actinomycetota bacterium]
MHGDNPSSAGNQQERPGFEQWVVGFVDGEGCFSVPIFRNSTYRLGWQAQPTFAVVQGERSVHVLHELKEFFGCGNVYVNRRHDNHREHLYRYDVRSPRDLLGRIIPFFEANPLRTAKADDFRKFAAIVRMKEGGLHKTVEGMIQIAKIVETMNHRKPSRFLESSEAIRQPPLPDGRAEDMVLASWRHGGP